MAQYTNNGAGMRGIVTKSGETVWAEPGETIEVADADKVPEDFEGGDGDDAPSLSKMTVDELKAFAEANNIDLGDASKKADIISAIELAAEAE